MITVQGSSCTAVQDAHMARHISGYGDHGSISRFSDFVRRAMLDMAMYIGVHRQILD